MWVETYQRARGTAPELPGKEVGALRRIGHDLAGGDLDVVKSHFELAAGLNCRPQPYPFAKPGNLTATAIAERWPNLTDSLNCREETDDQHRNQKRAQAYRQGKSTRDGGRPEQITLRVRN